MEIYCRKCALTGKGINKGWIINNEYYSELHMADEVAKSSDFKDWEEMYQMTGDDNYYTEWDCEDELYNGQEIFYLEKGVEVFIKKNNII